MGPLANPRRLDAMEAIVNDAKSRGGKIVTGGKRHGNQGYFFEPTVVTDVPDDSKLMTEEPFGPIAPIVPFKTFDEVVERANSLPFGLAAYAFTVVERRPRPRSATRSSPAWSASTRVAISTPETPFGGVKESGYGHEGGIEGLEAYTEHASSSRRGKTRPYPHKTRGALCPLHVRYFPASRHSPTRLPCPQSAQKQARCSRFEMTIAAPAEAAYGYALLNSAQRQYYSAEN